MLYFLRSLGYLQASRLNIEACLDEALLHKPPILWLSVMTQPAPAQYRTTNWKDYNAVLKARGSLLIWLDRAMQWHGQPTDRQGRSSTVSDAAIYFP